MNYEMNDEHTGFQSTALFMLAGAVIGAAAALIFAPATGRDTRAYLGRQGRRIADDVAEQGRRAWAEHGERVTQAVRRGYETATNAASNAMADAENRMPRQS
jgi:gas vesicle protein